jgi:hypothetical protein
LGTFDASSLPPPTAGSNQLATKQASLRGPPRDRKSPLLHSPLAAAPGFLGISNKQTPTLTSPFSFTARGSLASFFPGPLFLASCQILFRIRPHHQPSPTHTLLLLGTLRLQNPNLSNGFSLTAFGHSQLYYWDLSRSWCFLVFHTYTIHLRTSIPLLHCYCYYTATTVTATATATATATTTTTTTTTTNTTTTTTTTAHSSSRSEFGDQLGRTLPPTAASENRHKTDIPEKIIQEEATPESTHEKSTHEKLCRFTSTSRPTSNSTSTFHLYLYTPPLHSTSISTLHLSLYTLPLTPPLPSTSNSTSTLYL